MNDKKFDITKLERLNNPERLKMIDLKLLVSKLSLPDNSTLIDIGAGTGAFSEQMLNLIPNAKCFSYDISEEMINWIKENRIPKCNSRLQAELMTENKIPLDNNEADLVFMIAVHHELDNSKKLLHDANRILKTGGKILICDWKEGFNNHFVTKENIINDLKNAHFMNIKEVNAAEKFVCLIAEKN